MDNNINLPRSALGDHDLGHLLEDSEKALARYQGFATNAQIVADEMFAEIAAPIVTKIAEIVRERSPGASLEEVVKLLNTREARHNIAAAIVEAWEHEEIQDELLQTVSLACAAVTDKRCLRFHGADNVINWQCNLHLPTWKHLFDSWVAEVDQTTKLLRLAIDNPSLISHA